MIMATETSELNVYLFVKSHCLLIFDCLHRIYLLQSQQVTGKFSNVIDKVKVGGIPALYQGSIAAASATFVGHYPW